MKKIKNTTPGEILYQEFLKPLNITAYRLSKETKMPQTRIADIIYGRRKITVDTALRLSRYFGTTVEFWLNLQNGYEIRQKQERMKSELMQIAPFKKIA
jgi:addiction module HigA family antidote